jgi:hypothetical protein
LTEKHESSFARQHTQVRRPYRHASDESLPIPITYRVSGGQEREITGNHATLLWTGHFCCILGISANIL